ncbi:efflux RND transporter permease subunit [Leptothoe sp. PORK10 BA2]|uniref:efflux RND transporter permease subunit n=1 Tax=Leptothoe sp. PORK10 BA2 TaxID=3110254 RepID=UPI002B200299|nr:efflux RND transporter permease subunit [Leptothoe sp. PORK10 BA2]MEA5465990.1 efflux RND transporter permease subunit [Leptothoe sp. PORK10 BA2]
MFNLFFRNRQLLFLTLTLVVVWGFSAFLSLPRLEDPEIVQRVSTVTTIFPGASAERVESLVTDKIEEELSDIEEVEEIRSSSSPGISVVTVELKDTVSNVEPVWTRVRSQIEDAIPELPAEASRPEYEDSEVKASAMIVGLTWELDEPVNYAILRRVAEGLEAELRNLPGTDGVELFGEPDEEIQVNVSQADLLRLGISAQDLSQQIVASDAKISTGELRGSSTELLFEVDSALDSLGRMRAMPVRVGAEGQIAQLGDIAQVSKGVQTPVSDLALVEGKPALVVATTVESDYRVDQWAHQARNILNEFEADLSDGLGISIVLDQSRYVQQRLNGVIGNLLLSSLLVIGISLVILGWRSALIVGLALPLSTLMVFGCMQVLGIPLHQMSVTGLIIAMGLLIDNAIVVVDEIRMHLQGGSRPAEAVRDTVKQLALPLLASTLTTVLAFVPIATSPGGTGEFIGTIGSTVILALLSSLILSLTVIAALSGLVYRWRPLTASRHWLVVGWSDQSLSRLYEGSLRVVLSRPILGILAAMVLPVVGFVQFASLPQQFFPPTNRDQFQIELERPASSAIATTRTQTLAIRDLIQQHPAVKDIHWFLGANAPSFFYNVVGSRRNAADYAQGIVQLASTEDLRDTIRTLQTQLDEAFPDAQILVKQLEQGPPFDAPIEVSLYGPDLEQLRTLGDRLRLILSQLDDVTHTRATLTELSPQLALEVDEAAARRVGLSNGAIASQLRTLLDGQLGGSILEDTENIPVRVQLPEQERGDLASITSVDLLSSDGTTVPFSAVASVNLRPELSTIARQDGQRVNTVQAFITAGALPSTILEEFQKALKEQNFELPTGYRLSYGGEVDARGSAVGNLLSTAGVLVVLMTATLVLSFNSFALAGLLAVVAVAAVGLAAMALWLFDSLFGFTAILGTLGLIGLAMNDSIVVLVALQDDPLARQGDAAATRQVVVKATRHVVATTVTTIIGFTPLLLDSTGFWPPLAIAIAGGLGGATLLALYFIPAAHLLIYQSKPHSSKPLGLASERVPTQSGTFSQG